MTSHRLSVVKFEIKNFKSAVISKIKHCRKS